MGKVWNAPLDPRDYRMQEQEEQYEGPLFKQMMKKEPAETVGPRGSRPARQCKNPLEKKHWYERS